MADAEVARHKEAYSGRKSESTRNPHTVRTSKRVKDLSTLCPEERVLEQWRIANGCPVSDEAKIQFQVQARENTHRLADVRLWTEHHDPKSSKKVKDTGVIYLEFFFDGSPSDYADDQEVFTRAFEQMIERQLQERRVIEFRQKMATRRRGGAGGARNRSSEADGDDTVEGGGGEAVCEDDKAWKEYLRRPVPATNLSVRSLREAGCMIQFLVVQTSLSVSAGEVLGQIAFQEYFPIDGRAQDLPKCDKPLPKWVNPMIYCTALFGLVALFCLWQIMRQAIFTGPSV